MQDTHIRTIDLRSDTVTNPSAPMRSAKAQADVGDDLFAEAPSVKRLEGMAAARYSGVTGGKTVRLVTHLHVTAVDIPRVVAAYKEFLSS